MVEIEGYNLPDELYYTDRNLWVKLEPDGTVRVGFNDLAQKLAGKITGVRFFPVGKKVKKDKIFGSVESAKWVERLKAPVSGTIIEVNEELKRNPSLINKDPYGTGWFVRIKPESQEQLEVELSNLAHGKEAVEKFLKEQIKKLVKK